jgi:iron complex outermembrane receptor protein
VQRPVCKRQSCRNTPLGQAISRILAGACVLTGVAVSAGASAQSTNTPQTLDRVTVTGSNIPRSSVETASPVQVVTREDIDRTGKAAIGNTCRH